MEYEYVIDVVIHTTRPDRDTSRTLINTPFNLSTDICIESLDNRISDEVFNMCSKGYNFNPTRQFGQLYSFVRKNPPLTEIYNWDNDRSLQQCISLSRIVHPTSISFKYSARIFVDSNGNPNMIVPGSISGPGSAAFVVEPATDFLSEIDGDEIHSLLEAVERKPPKDPIARAMWFYEYASRSYEIDLRWTLIATGIESLIHTDKYKSTKQFVNRIQELSKILGLGDISENDAEEMYELRSKLSHGQGFGSLSADNNELYKRMEELLRFTIRKALLDEAFCDFLSDPENIRKSWPIE